MLLGVKDIDQLGRKSRIMLVVPREGLLWKHFHSLEVQMAPFCKIIRKGSRSCLVAMIFQGWLTALSKANEADISSIPDRNSPIAEIPFHDELNVVAVVSPVPSQDLVALWKIAPRPVPWLQHVIVEVEVMLHQPRRACSKMVTVGLPLTYGHPVQKDHAGALCMQFGFRRRKAMPKDICSHTQPPLIRNAGLHALLHDFSTVAQ